MSIDIRTPEGGTSGGVELPAEIFDVQANIPLMHQVVVAQLAAARQGTHDTKTRGETRGGGRKPYRQKGTGRARQGSIRAPHYAGGGTAHGPTPRNYAQRTPKKMKAAALRGALSDRARAGRVHVISGVVDGDQPSTKGAIALLAGISTAKHVLVVVRADDLVARQEPAQRRPRPHAVARPAQHVRRPGQRRRRVHPRRARRVPRRGWPRADRGRRDEAEPEGRGQEGREAGQGGRGRARGRSPRSQSPKTSRRSTVGRPVRARFG